MKLNAMIWVLIKNIYYEYILLSPKVIKITLFFRVILELSSWWLAMENRISRLYVAKSHSTKSLLLPTKQVIKIDAPMWFMVKSNFFCHECVQIFVSNYL